MRHLALCLMITAMCPMASQATPDKTPLPATPLKPSLVQSTKSGLKIVVTKRGPQQKLKEGDFIVVHYTGLFTSGKKFDSSLDRSEPFGFRLGSGAVIKGWDEGFKHLHVGDQALFIIPPSLAYGSKGRGDAMPPDSTLVFLVEVLGTKKGAVSEVIEKTLQAKGVAAAISEYRDLRGKGFADLFSSQEDLMLPAYHLMKQGKNQDCLTLLQFYADEHPQSASAFESLGEVHEKVGDTAKAIQSYERSLQLDPKNPEVTEKLKQLKSK